MPNRHHHPGCANCATFDKQMEAREYFPCDDCRRENRLRAEREIGRLKAEVDRLQAEVYAKDAQIIELKGKE